MNNRFRKNLIERKDVCGKEVTSVKAGEYARVKSYYTDSYGNKVVVPAGWVVSGRAYENTVWGKNKSVVIYRVPEEKATKINWNNQKQVENIQRQYDQLVWVPVKFLKNDGTLNGEDFTQKFGRRNYSDEDIYSESLNTELKNQSKSVNKYGGFYISRYNISCHFVPNEGIQPKSVKGYMPWGNIGRNLAKKVAEIFLCDESTKSHLTYGAEYDSIMAWLIESKSKTLEEVAFDSSDWGNYIDSANSAKEFMITGSRKSWKANNMYDIAGNVDEWTQEMDGKYTVIRGGTYDEEGSMLPANARSSTGAIHTTPTTSFRVALYIK